MRERQGKRKEVGTPERFPPKKNFINGKDLLTVVGLEAFIAKPPLQITKINTRS